MCVVSRPPSLSVGRIWYPSQTSSAPSLATIDDPSLNRILRPLFYINFKDKSGVGIIVDYSIQSANKCEMTSFSMTSLHVDLNEAA